ncbi:hypothetical protein [Sphingomonas montana]|uniref:hypothetical protein n=1 Tax=Sphingomonas montana TaxID=1843236 RepID=UPI00096EF452|nr:hypothetical protein [Sphingomonas montana]
MRRLQIVGIAVAFGVAGGPVNAADPVATAPAIREMEKCRAVPDVATRATCYDKAFDGLQASLGRREVVLMNRGDVVKARRSLFGLTLPKLDIFSRGASAAEEAEFQTLETRIVQASQTANGRWSFLLEDQARWVQNDDEPLAVPPRPNDTIRIRKGLVGSFLANVGGQRAIRVRRIN